MLRPVGIGERIATIQHFLGSYRCVCITARYTLNCKDENWRELFEDAVCKATLRHPVLCAGIKNHDTNNPIFVRLGTIDLSTHVEYTQVSDGDYDRSLARILERRHSESFRDFEQQPAWKLIIVQNDVPDPSRVLFNAVFAFHHVLGDGRSGFIFHNSVLEALNHPQEPVELKGRILQIPKNIRIPPPIEKQLDLKISWSFFFKRVWSYLDLTPAWMKAPTPWVPTPCLLEHIQNYSSKVKVISIDAAQVARVLSACRAHGTTLTGLLSALVVASLSFRIPEAESFVGCIPYSMRHLLQPTARGEIGNYVSGLAINHPSTTTSALRSSRNDGDCSKEIWNIARAYVREMSTKLAHIPNDLDIGLMHLVKDPVELFSACIDKPRRTTFELSNIGAFERSKVGGDWEIGKVLFSQSGQGIEAAICFNAASVAGGPLVIGITWLEGAIEALLVDELSGDVESVLNRVGEEGVIMI